MSRKLEDACPELQIIIPQFKDACADLGIDVLVYQTYRGEAEQNKAFAEGKSKLKFPHSKHNVTVDGKPSARAFDCVPTKGQTIQWQDTSNLKKMGEIGKEMGLRWGGDFNMDGDKTTNDAWDKYHFELRG